MKRFTITLPDDLCFAAEERANKEERTLASLIRLAVRAYLGKPTKPKHHEAALENHIQTQPK